MKYLLGKDFRSVNVSCSVSCIKGDNANLLLGYW
jgi:hypothetical protein